MLTKDPLTAVLGDTRYLVKTAFAAQTVATGNTITASDAWTHSGAVSFTAAGTAVSVTNAATVGGTLGVTGLSTLTGGFTASAASTISAGYSANVWPLEIRGTGGSATAVIGAANGAAATRLSSTNGFVELISDFNGTDTRGALFLGVSLSARTSLFWNGTSARTELQSSGPINFVPSGVGAANGLQLTLSTAQPTFTSVAAAGANTGFTFNASNGPNTTAVFQSSSSTVVTISSAGAITVGASGTVISKAATSAALSARNATATLADLNLNVLGADPGTLQDGDFWIKNAAGVRTLNARIAGVSYSVQIS